MNDHELLKVVAAKANFYYDPMPPMKIPDLYGSYSENGPKYWWNPLTNAAHACELQAMFRLNIEHVLTGVIADVVYIQVKEDASPKERMQAAFRALVIAIAG